MTIFWDTKEQEVIEDSEDVQFFPLDCPLRDTKIPKAKLRPGYEKEKDSRKASFLSVYHSIQKGDKLVIEEKIFRRSRESSFLSSFRIV